MAYDQLLLRGEDDAPSRSTGGRDAMTSTLRPGMQTLGGGGGGVMLTQQVSWERFVQRPERGGHQNTHYLVSSYTPTWPFEKQ